MSRSERAPAWSAMLAATGLALALAPGAPLAAESYAGCDGFVDALPANVTSQGVWCLRADLSTAIASGAAITINANNATIDCNGFKVGGLAAGDATAAMGIYSAGRQNSTVRRCNARGFAVGIALNGGDGHLVEDNRLDGNTLAGILVSGLTGTVRRNLVVDTGGGTTSPDVRRTGIFAYGTADVVDNTVAGVVPGTTADTGVSGILVGDGFATRNRISGLVSAFASEGFQAQGEYGTILEGNVVTGPAGFGVRCLGNTAVIRGNTWNGTVNDRQGCLVGGGNVHRP